MNYVTRAYELKQRAERQEQTRQQIIEAAIELHQTLGPARTTVTDIADRAGVSRLTVYRHFPDELTLGMACSGLYWELHPLPDPEAWRSFPTLAGRLRAALEETYAYHRQTEPMMSHALADSADTPIMQPYHEHWRHAAAVVAKAGPHGDPGDPMLRAAAGHALAFGTWRSLTRDHELTDQEAIELMLRLVPAAESQAHRLNDRTRRVPPASPPSPLPSTRRASWSWRLPLSWRRSARSRARLSSMLMMTGYRSLTTASPPKTSRR